MKTGLGLSTARTSAVAAFALALAAAPVGAQQGDDCRCVDRQGNEIERCSCFRQPRLGMLGAPWGESDERPRLGISVDVRQSARRDAEGALVTDVLEDGPADEAGLRRGDIITRIDGQSLFEPLAGDVEDDFDLDDSVPVQRLLAIAGGLEPGEEVEVEYLRDGETATVAVTAEDLAEAWGRRFSVMPPDLDMDRLHERLRGLGDELGHFEFRYEEQEGRSEPGDGFDLFVPGPEADVRVFGGPGASGLVVGRLGGARYGVELVELNPSLGAYFGTEAGVLVADVTEESPLGLRPGDVVLRVGDREVATPERMLRILGTYGDDEAVTLRIRRDDREMDVEGRVGR